MPTKTIRTVAGKAKFVKTEVEDAQGNWNNNYWSYDGYYVIHEGKKHHVYKVDTRPKWTRLKGLDFDKQYRVWSKGNKLIAIDKPYQIDSAKFEWRVVMFKNDSVVHDKEFSTRTAALKFAKKLRGD